MNVKQKDFRPIYRLTSRSLHLDSILLGFLFLLICMGLLILYSASNQNFPMLLRQVARLIFALGILFIFSEIPPHQYKTWTPWVYGSCLGLLFAVMVMGKTGKGVQRWLDLGLFRFQPSEMMKLAVPMMAAWYADHDHWSPKSFTSLLTILAIIFVPTIIIAKQPDLGTAIMVAAAGSSVVFLAGIERRFLIGLFGMAAVAAPIVWFGMHPYQKQRIFTLFNPEQDPLGNGYHIIQSKIAIGSGGPLGKGWLEGSQSHLNFLPEHTTDFIFAVCGEEFGFIGSALLIGLFIIVTLRGFAIAKEAQTHFTRLLAASLTITFFLSAFVNMSMVMGILPVVGIPLPLVSYGGTAMVTFLASFGILMSISSHRILFTMR